jgi:hypothetical protein
LPKRVVIIAPHPDDEAIGCGGLIQTLVERGTSPHVIILTGGEGSHRGCCDITAEDLINTVKNVEADFIIVPSIMLKPYSDLFLDGNSMSDVIEKTGKKFFVIENNYSISEVFDLFNEYI